MDVGIVMTTSWLGSAKVLPEEHSGCSLAIRAIQWKTLGARFSKQGNNQTILRESRADVGTITYNELS